MKNTILLILLLSSFKLTAQVSESLRPMSQGNNNSLTVSFNGISTNDAERIWKKYVDQFGGKSKYTKKAKELFVDNASIGSINDNTIDIYSKAEKLGDDVIFTVWFDLGGAYLSSAAHPTKYPAASDLMSGYIKEVNRFKTSEKLKEEEKKLSGLESDLKDMNRDKENYEKEIKKAEERIADYRSKIEQKVKDQSAKQAEIESQKTAVDGVKSTLDKI